jgi:NitT/TauT family transport system ATP-binding protein
MTASVEFRGLRRVFGSTTALDGLDLTIEPGELIALLGPSGCGKTTALRCVAGFETPDAGAVLVDGKDITRLPANRRDAGMVFQSYSLFPWMTVRENICFGLREKGMPKAEQMDISGYFLEKVGLRQFADHYPKTLSGGMKQRTALARALANDPKVLLLDEPFGALDNQTRALMQELLLGIWEADRKTVLFVTHDIDEAIFLANRVVVMTARPGRIKCDVAVDLPHPRTYTVKTSPEFAEYKARLTEEIRVETIRADEMAVG